jgi:phospholipid N-methyltransferase
MLKVAIRALAPPIALDAARRVLRRPPPDTAGGSYIDAATTIAAAKAAGMSICDWRESREDDPRKVGRRDRIIARMEAAGCFQKLRAVAEIGPGTGMYAEKVLPYLDTPAACDFYEIDAGWADYLERELGMYRRDADGHSMWQAIGNNRDLVHAHGVFIYLPLLHTYGYLKECARVCRPGGHIVFDVYTEASFASVAVAESWLETPHRFPVVTPRALVADFARVNGLSLVDEWQEVHGGGTCDYFIFRKD